MLARLSADAFFTSGLDASPVRLQVVLAPLRYEATVKSVAGNGSRRALLWHVATLSALLAHWSGSSGHRLRAYTADPHDRRLCHRRVQASLAHPALLSRLETAGLQPFLSGPAEFDM